MATSLVSLPTLVQSPFIIADIAGITFGSYSGNQKTKSIYPNFMKSMSITKVNGTVNTYTLSFEYQVRPGEDPNLLDKIFSRAANSREIILKYGDWNAPEYIYKEEKCIITNLTSNLDMNSSKISYTLSCTSDAIGLNSVGYNFPAREAKPSDVLKQLITSSSYGIKNVFTGMRNMSKVLSSGLLASNDAVVKLVAKTNYTVLDYINYLVDSMIPNNPVVKNIINTSKYFLTIHDDYTNDFGGTYFRVDEVSKDTPTYKATDTYALDINYPGDNFVTQFSVNNDQSWAILYDFSQSIKQEEYSYSIDNNGRINTSYAPSIAKSAKTNQTDPEMSSWWTKMTEFPIEATVTIKGLTRPSMLMSYVKLNVWFAGGIKHISSGTYIITKQVDNISSAGYTTTLTLLRVRGDE